VKTRHAARPGRLAQHAGGDQLVEQAERRLRAEPELAGEAAGGQHRRPQREGGDGRQVAAAASAMPTN
jgi:hypothetical protein